MKIALAQTKEGRLHILLGMKDALDGGRGRNVSDYAPRMLTTMKINPEKIRDVIGKGGAGIRSSAGNRHRSRSRTMVHHDFVGEFGRRAGRQKANRRITAEVEASGL